jgi:hypothetical protein
MIYELAAQKPAYNDKEVITFMESIENHTAKTTDPIYIKMMESQYTKIPNHYSQELY